VLRWRTVEDADAGGQLVDGETRRAASRAGLEPAGGDFLIRRARWLDEHAGAGARASVETLTTPQLPSWPGGFMMLSALVLGYVLVELGDVGRINLLALPLVGILLWNAIVTVIAVGAEFTSRDTRQSWISYLLRKRDAGGLKAFQERVLPLLATRADTQIRIWLHLAAALLALGGVAGLYSKGWSREYRAVWESTLLDTPQVTQFFGTLFRPAERTFGLTIPLEQLDSMRTGVGRPAVHGSPALPWIHLYAGTLLLLVVVPRLGLVLLSRWRGAVRMDQAWAGLKWEDYERRLRRGASTQREHVWMVTHGFRRVDERRDAWSTRVEDCLGTSAQTEYVAVPPGAEDEFTEQWSDSGGILVLIFNAAATPEVEVQGRLAMELKRKFGGRVAALIDAENLRQRRGRGSVETRQMLWRETLKGSVDEVWLDQADEL